MSDLDELTTEDIYKAVRQVTDGSADLADYGKPSRKWYVEVFATKYELKRLLRLAYEIHFGYEREYNFHTQKARSVLVSLGFECIESR